MKGARALGSGVVAPIVPQALAPGSPYSLVTREQMFLQRNPSRPSILFLRQDLGFIQI